MNFVKRKKKKKRRNFHFQIMKNVFGSGPFSMGRSDKGKQKYLFLALLCLQFLFMNTVLARIFGGFMLPHNIVYLLPCPWIVSSKSGSLKIKTSIFLVSLTST